MGDEELLELGEVRTPRFSRGARVATVGVLAVLVALVVLVDRELRGREERAVAACADEVAVAIEVAGRPVRAAYEYVRPSISNPSPELRAGIRRLMANAAVDSGTALTAPRRRCEDISVLPLHDELQARRDRCLAVLEEQRSVLDAIGLHVSGLGDWLRAPRSC